MQSAGEAVSKIIAAKIIVITSYSIHYTKLYDFSEQADGVRCPYFRAFFVEAAGELQQATGAVHRHAVGTALLDVGQLVGEDPLGDRRVAGKGVGAAEAAAAA